MFILLLILAFTVGSIWVATITVITERKGTAWGILGGLSSTAAFSLLFIGINASSQAAVDASVVFPLVFSVTNAFLLLYAVLVKRGFAFGLGSALVVWLASSFAVFTIEINSYSVCLVAGGVISVLRVAAFFRFKLPRQR
jgi:hypothetical protein